MTRADADRKMSSARSPGSHRKAMPLQQSQSQTQAASPARRSLRLRIVIAGAEATGKSCIIKRYCEKRFVPRYLPTIGIDYGATKIYVDKREVSIHIFDTSGSRVFSEVRNEFYRDTHGILLVFDVSSRESFDALCEWTKEIYLELAKEGRDFDKTALVVCANKCDAGAARQVDELEARLWAEIRGFPFFETSAYSGEGINDMFHAFFSHILRIHDEGGSGLPKTPSSARKVQLTKSGSNASVSSISSTASTTQRNRRSNSHASKAGDPGAALLHQQPSPEQLSVMSRLRSGRDAWQQMGLTVGCSHEEVNKAYRKLAMLLHPDKTAVAGADEAFKTLGMARRNILKTMGKAG